jgi:hypothetical protein
VPGDLSDNKEDYTMARNVISPNNTGPVPQRAHPERDNASDPRRPYDKLPESRQDKGFINATFGGPGGMDKGSARRDDTRQYARDEVSRHLREHRSWQR